MQESATHPQKLFEKFFEFCPDAVLVTNAQGQIRGGNARLETLFGYTRSELANQPVEILIPERFRDAHPAHREAYIEHPRLRPMASELQRYGRRRNGSEFPVDIVLGSVETDQGELVLSVIRDISNPNGVEEIQRQCEEQRSPFCTGPVCQSCLDLLTESVRGQHKLQAVQQQLAHEHDRVRLLLEINNAVVSKLEISELFPSISSALRQILPHDFSQLYLYDGDIKQLRTRAQYFPNSKGLVHEGMIVPIEGTPAGWVFSNRRPMRMDRPDAVRTPNDIVDRLLEEGVRSGLCVPLAYHDHVLGVLSVGSRREAAFSQDDEDLLCTVAGQFAIAIENALTHDSLRRSELELAEGNSRLRLLLELNNAFVTKLGIHDLFATVSSSLRRLTRHDYSQIVLRDPESGELKIRALDFPKGKGLLHEGLIVPVENTPVGNVYKTRQALLVERLEKKQFPSEMTDRLLDEGVRSMCLIPLIVHDRTLGVLSIGCSREAAFSRDDLEIETMVAGQIAIAIDNALAYEHIAKMNERLKLEKIYLEEEVLSQAGFEEFIGESAGLKRVLSEVETVAPTDSTVLITGETGTGKELVARAIHQRSARGTRPFIKLNCAAIPTGLLESELFGHEKGAFTGAITHKVGRLQLAHQGTLFLDEIGDIALELQPKLLRVLQEGEFEPLGSNKTHHVDVRLLAATNRDLHQMIAAREFRSDLYYRLNVFPVSVPALRDRAEDIPLLIRYFVQKYARRMNKKITRIPPEALKALSRWQWPGNIRELENFVERAVILSKGNLLVLPIAEEDAMSRAAERDNRLDTAEREQILRVLRATKSVVGGAHGAAAKLGLKRTTLNAKMRRLGISRSDI